MNMAIKLNDKVKARISKSVMSPAKKIEVELTVTFIEGEVYAGVDANGKRRYFRLENVIS